MTTGLVGTTFYFDGLGLTTEEIAWIVQEAAKIGQASYNYGFIYRVEDDHIVMGVGSRSARDNIRVAPVDTRQDFMPGACFTGIVLVPADDNWGHHPQDDGRTTEADYIEGRQAFQKNIEIAFRRARDQHTRFPALEMLD